MTDIESAIELARQLGNPASRLAILAEGNVSVRAEEGTFWIKASGTSLEHAHPGSMVEIKHQPVLEALDQELSDDAVHEVLESSRSEAGGPKPSVETFMHAWLLTLPGVRFVGHTHPTALLPILCSEETHAQAGLRLFPDEVVCCGPVSPVVPYVDPGVPLARAMRDAVTIHVEKYGTWPKTIWMQNHGLTVLGKTAGEVLAGTLMTAKAAEVRLARPLGELRPLSPAHVHRIASRADEHYRQKFLQDFVATKGQ